MRPWIPIVAGKTYASKKDNTTKTVTRVVRIGKKIMVYYEHDGLTLGVIENVCSDKCFKQWAARNPDGSLVMTKRAFTYTETKEGA